MSLSRKYDVFVSYRREGGLDHARTVCNELTKRGFRCFFDFNELKTGKFTDGIKRAVEGCSYFVLILTDGALDRCREDAEDWVRKEIELALSLGKPIVPVCPTGNRRSIPSDLPGTLKGLDGLQVSQLQRDEFFKQSIDLLVKDRLVGVKAASVRRRMPLIAISSLVLVVAILGILALVAYNRAQERAAEAARAERAAQVEAENKARLAKLEAEHEAQLAKQAAEAEAKRVKAEAERARLAAEERARESARLKAEVEKKAKEREQELLAKQKQAEAEKARLEKAKAEAERKRAEEEEKAKLEKAKAMAAAQRAVDEEKARLEKAKAESERKRKLEDAAKERERLLDSL